MSNERPVPNTTEGIFLKDNNCNERIYTYLLLKSKFNPNGRETHRYLEKISNIKIAEDLGLNRNTVGTRIKDLERRLEDKHIKLELTQEAKDYLINNGYDSNLIVSNIDMSKGHNESAWREYFVPAYKWLIGIE